MTINASLHVYENTVAIVEDDDAVRNSVECILVSAGINTLSFRSALAFFSDFSALQCNCVIFDIRMSEMSGIEAHKKLIESGRHIPVVFITGHGSVRLAVEAMKLGAVEFLEKPFNNEMLIDAVHSALKLSEINTNKKLHLNELQQRYENLTDREKSIFILLARGVRAKEIADKLFLSARTVELYRARIGKKFMVSTIPQLTMIAMHLKVIENDQLAP